MSLIFGHSIFIKFFGLIFCTFVLGDCRFVFRDKSHASHTLYNIVWFSVPIYIIFLLDVILRHHITNIRIWVYNRMSFLLLYNFCYYVVGFYSVDRSEFIYSWSLQIAVNWGSLHFDSINRGPDVSLIIAPWVHILIFWVFAIMGPYLVLMLAVSVIYAPVINPTVFLYLAEISTMRQWGYCSTR